MFKVEIIETRLSELCVHDQSCEKKKEKTGGMNETYCFSGRRCHAPCQRLRFEPRRHMTRREETPGWEQDHAGRVQV